jgi:hypothetical protein
MIRALSRWWRKSMPASVAKNKRSAKAAARLISCRSRKMPMMARLLQGLAQVYVWTAEKEHAIEVLEKLVRSPGYVAYGYLLRDPIWDSFAR